jgi:hypothetical protein
LLTAFLLDQGACEYIGVDNHAVDVECVAAHYGSAETTVSHHARGALKLLAVLACEPLDPLGSKDQALVALVDRGGCSFGQKLSNIQLAGFVGAIIGDNGNGTLVPPGLGSDSSLSIPCVMVSRGSAVALKKHLVGVSVGVGGEASPPSCPHFAIALRR